jgi:DNA excision repair protein ERCC-4
MVGGMSKSTSKKAIATTDLPKIVVDTREQRPYLFPHFVSKALKAGDYSLEGFESRVAVERKSKEDAYGSLGSGRQRFEAEWLRLSKLDYGGIVIESGLPDFLREPPAYSLMNPRAALCTLVAWSIKYGVPVWFAGDRRHAKALVLRLLTYWWNYAVANNAGTNDDRDAATDRACLSSAASDRE